MRKQAKHTHAFLAGFLSAVLSMALIVSAGAVLTGKAITVYTDVSIFVDGVKMDPRDANGNRVDPFIYNGTTYVPLRAVSQYLGKAVDWDGETRTVYIGEVPGKKQYLREVCPPYQWNRCYYPSDGYYMMAGQKYTHCMSFGKDSWSDEYHNGWALYNLNGQYSTLSFDVGHLDGSYMSNAQLNIYLDGDLAFTADLAPKMLPIHYDVPLYGALQMEIRTSGSGTAYGLANVEIY